MNGLRRLTPTASERSDVAFGSVLVALAVVGYRTTFSGSEELLVGMPAVIAGTIAGFVIAKLRVPLLPAVASAVAVMFLLAGPLALRHHTIAGAVPTVDAFAGLARGMVSGWRELLTTLPPAGEAGDLLAIPYVSGFAGAALTIAVAIRFPRSPACTLPAVVVLALSVLMGTDQPASIVLQGAAFAALLMAWISVRYRRARQLTTIAPSRQRTVMAAGLMSVAAIGGLIVGPQLPGAAANERFVLRDRITPPFDPLLEPSALAAYRNFTDQEFRDVDMFTVRGLPAGAHLRIAVMDDYDGLVWRATGRGSVVAGEYLRVGSRIPADGFGPEREIEVRVHRPLGVWVPLAGDLTALRFTGERADDLNREVRVSIQSDGAAVPGELQAGDTYRFQAEFAAMPDREDLLLRPMDARFRRAEATDVPVDLQAYASDTAGGAATEVAIVDAIAERLRDEGGYSDGGADSPVPSPPGHSLARLGSFLLAPQPVGNGEQFAAGLGLAARSLGIPVRVVMGFRNDDGGGQQVTFKGEDIRAWVEVPVDGLGWVPVEATPPESQLPDPQRTPRSLSETPQPQPPPPTTIPPATSIPEEVESEPEEDDDEDITEDAGLPFALIVGGLVVGVPALFLGGPVAAILFLKRRRRRRRQTVGPPSSRVSGSFAELVDYLRDSGRSVPPRGTRLEVSGASGLPTASQLALRADAAVFGPGEPDDTEIELAWRQFLEARSELVAEMTAIDRMRTATSLRSLRAPR